MEISCSMHLIDSVYLLYSGKVFQLFRAPIFQVNYFNSTEFGTTLIFISH